LQLTPQQLSDGRALLFKISKFIQMSNRNSKVEGKQSSPAIAKLPVSSRYIRKEAKKQIYKCKESCYGKNTNASNVSEGDYGRWTDWEDVLVKFAKHILKNGC